MRELITDVDALVDVAYLTRFVRAYHDACARTEASAGLEEGLTMGELWAIPTMLRVALLELLTEAVAEVADLSVTHRGPGDLERRMPGPVDLASDLSPDTVVAHAVRSLRTIANQDWSTFFETVSQVDAVLRDEPAGVYGRMTFKSRDQYRKVIETLALRSRFSEVGVAHEAVALAEAAVPDGAPSVRQARRSHVGFYLLGKGRSQLEARLDYRLTAVERVRRWLFDHATIIYLTSIAFLTLLVVGAVVAYGLAAGGSVASLVLTAVLTLIPASVVSVNGVNAIITRVVPPSRLPKFEFRAGIPDDCRTVIVVPAMLTSPEEVDFLVQRLERHYLSNATLMPSANLRFALLTDFADAPEAHMPEDDDLLDRAVAGIETLNHRYRRALPVAPSDGDGDGASSGEVEKITSPFYLLHRRRQWNEKEDVWMGWERKRGKLEEFNRLLLDDRETSYTTQVGDIPGLVGSRYVITLDSDTILSQDSTHRLIATLAHPLNRAEFDPETGRVVAGYTVLQPRTEVQPTSVNATRLTRIFAGDAGLDLYTLAVSDVYQDLFGEGSFVGKGIYDVAAFHRSLAGRVPENALLSHDLFEGIHGRAGLVTDVVLYEDYPQGYLTYMHRQHRWWRGDWQLLPWLFPRVPSAPQKASAPQETTAAQDGPATVRNQLSALDR
jgi:cyclic beta-1,2-glucan synthetase